MYSEKSNGPKVEPWGTPSGQCRNSGLIQPIFCKVFRAVVVRLEKLKAESLERKVLWSALLNVLLKQHQRRHRCLSSI